MIDQTPITWVDGVTSLDDATINGELRNAYMLLLNPPFCSVHSSATQSIPNGATWTAITWDSVALIDTEASNGTPMFAAAHPTRITAQTSGWYECIATVRENNLPAANLLHGGFRVNGSMIYLGSTVGRSVSILDAAPSNLIKMTAGDYIEFILQHDYASPILSSVVGYIPNMTIVRRRGI